jgi:hypothetical protein
MYKYKLIVAFLGPFLLLSCKNSNPDALLQKVRGSANDVVVVMTNKYWNSNSGELIRKQFSQPCSGLPQDEPLFDIMRTSHSGFDQTYKRQRNIVITQIGPNYKKNISVQNDVWAKPQLVINIMAPNQEAFEEYFLKVKDKISGIIQQKERERLMDAYASTPHRAIKKKLNTKYNIDLDVPVGFNVANESDDYIWLHHEYRNIQEGILVYFYPYKDSNTFTKEYLIRKRNSVLKNSIEGTIEGSYMATEERFPIEYTEFSMNNNKYTVEMRGLWKMVGGTAMGGPFLSLTQYDEARKRIVTIEGFIFAPSIISLPLTLLF